MAKGKVGKDNARETAVEIHDLTVAYKHRPVLWDIDMTIPRGVMLAIVGPNGAGKSTLIKTMLDIVKPATGEIAIFGKPYREQRKQVGYVPQRGTVDWDFPTTVLDVVLMGRYGHLGWLRRPGSKDKKLALESLKKVGMEQYANRQISQLSGGQQQRVFLARALVQDAKIYFLDEPMVGIDATTEKVIISLLKQLRDEGKTVVVVQHDITTLKKYYDWAMLLNVKKIAIGPIDEVITKKNLETAYGGRAAFLGASISPEETP